MCFSSLKVNYLNFWLGSVKKKSGGQEQFDTSFFFTVFEKLAYYITTYSLSILEDYGFKEIGFDHKIFFFFNWESAEHI